MTRFALLCALILGCGDDSAPADAAPDTTDAPSDAGPDVMMPDASDAGPCGECSAPTPLCNTTTMMCVTCLSETDCSGDTPLCDDDGACVACLGNDDCSGNTPICTDGSCTACTADPQCTELTETPVCDELSGACVACTADDESACGPNVCDLDTLTCTDTPANSTGLCSPCVSDRQCNTGMTCAPMAFDDTDLGHFCLWRREAPEGPNGSCLREEVRPYAGNEDITTRSGDTATVCTLRNSTCEALADFSATDCADGMLPDTDDAACGVEGLDDGLCREVDAITNRCTTRCGSTDDCLEGFTCNTGESPRYCNF